MTASAWHTESLCAQCTVYIYIRTLSSVYVACFAELVETGLWDVWTTEQHAPDTKLLPRPVGLQTSQAQRNQMY